MSIKIKGAIPITGGHFSNSSVSVLIGGVDCKGNETHILECSHVTQDHESVIQCDPNEIAGVICQGIMFVILMKT